MSAAGGLKKVDVILFNLGKSNLTHINVDMLANIQNPALMEIAPLGVLEFVVFYENSSMGVVQSNNVTLVRGNNYVRLFGAWCLDEHHTN